MLPKPSTTLSLPCFPLGVVGAPGNHPTGEITGISLLIISFDASWEGGGAPGTSARHLPNMTILLFSGGGGKKKKHPERYAGL